MKTEIITVPIYQVKFHLKIYEIEAEVYVNSREYPFKNRIGCVYRNDENEPVIVLNWFFDLTPAEVAHEAKHLVNEIFIDISAQLDLNNDEFECYLLQWVMEEIYKIKDKVYEK